MICDDILRILTDAGQGDFSSRIAKAQEHLSTSGLAAGKDCEQSSEILKLARSLDNLGQSRPSLIGGLEEKLDEALNCEQRDFKIYDF